MMASVRDVPHPILSLWKLEKPEVELKEQDVVLRAEEKKTTALLEKALHLWTCEVTYDWDFGLQTYQNTIY